MQVTRAIRDIVYPRKKYLLHYNDDLCFSIDPNSVCFLILDYLQRNPSVNTAINRDFWQSHKSIVPRTLNLKRSTVMFAIRKKFKGKHRALIQYYTCYSLHFIVSYVPVCRLHQSTCESIQNSCLTTWLLSVNRQIKTWFVSCSILLQL